MRLLGFGLSPHQRRKTRGDGVPGGVLGELGHGLASRSRSGSLWKRPTGGGWRLNEQFTKCSGGRRGTGGGVSGRGSLGGGGGGLCSGWSVRPV